MKKYNVRITEYYRIDGIRSLLQGSDERSEAESLEEAERIAAEDHFWADHFRDVTIDAEEVEA
jgi:uncharacterized protein YciI